ncbi:MAG: hypothetical protein QXU54_03560 [Candidatus Micrarchaeia archaeon]
MPRVAFDTSFLMFLARRKIPPSSLIEVFDGPVEAYTSRGVLNELYAIASSSRSSAAIASVGIKLVKALKMEVVPDTQKPDSWLLGQPCIATADMRLARAARRLGIKVISITKSNRIVAR